jgi:hypothetical protein
MTPKEAKALNICIECRRAPTLCQRTDGTGTRAIVWCFDCKRPAFAGASFVRVSEPMLSRLPRVEYAS